MEYSFTSRTNPLTSFVFLRVYQKHFHNRNTPYCFLLPLHFHFQPGLSAASWVLPFDSFLQSWNQSVGLQGAGTRHDFLRMLRWKRAAYGDCSFPLSCQDGHLFWEAFSVVAESVPAVSVGRTF